MKHSIKYREIQRGIGMNKIKLVTEVLKKNENYYTEIGLNHLMYLVELLTKVRGEIGSNDFAWITETMSENLGEFVLIMQYLNGGENND